MFFTKVGLDLVFVMWYNHIKEVFPSVLQHSPEPADVLTRKGACGPKKDEIKQNGDEDAHHGESRASVGDGQEPCGEHGK